MEVFLSYRLEACLAAVIFGVGAGVLYDVLRICYMAFGINYNGKKRGKVSFAVCIIFDLLYSLIVSLGFAVLTYAFSSGKLRLEVYFFSILGFAAYNLSVGKLVMLCARQIISILKRVFRFIIKVILAPIFLLVRGLKLLCRWLYRNTFGLCIKKITHSASRARLNKLMNEKLPDSVRF